MSSIIIGQQVVYDHGCMNQVNTTLITANMHRAKSSVSSRLIGKYLYHFHLSREFVILRAVFNLSVKTNFE